MSYKATLTKPAQRFRVYAKTPALRRLTLDDHLKRAAQGKPPLKSRGRVRYQVDGVVVDGKVSGDSVTINAKDPVSQVVFYAGPVDREEVVGSLDVNDSGKIDIDLVVDPAAAAASAPGANDEYEEYDEKEL